MADTQPENDAGDSKDGEQQPQAGLKDFITEQYELQKVFVMPFCRNIMNSCRISFVMSQVSPRSVTDQTSTPVYTGSQHLTPP